MFVVENNSGLEDATSYVTVAEADQYFLSYGNDDTWGTLSNQRKQQLLNTASRALDSTFSYVGRKVNIRQALEFPRTFRTYGYGYVPRLNSGYGYRAYPGYCTTDRCTSDTFAAHESIVPRPVRHAVSELAFRLSQEDRYTEFRTRDLGIASTRVGDIEVEYTRDPVRSTNRKRLIPKYISELVSDFISRGVRGSITVSIG